MEEEHRSRLVCYRAVIENTSIREKSRLLNTYLGQQLNNRRFLLLCLYVFTLITVVVSFFMVCSAWPVWLRLLLIFSLLVAVSPRPLLVFHTLHQQALDFVAWVTPSAGGVLPLQ